MDLPTLVTGTLTAEVVFKGVVLAERLEVAAGLLAVQPNLVHVVVADQIIVGVSGAGANDADARADTDDRAVATLNEFVARNVRKCDIVAEQRSFIWSEQNWICRYSQLGKV